MQNIDFINYNYSDDEDYKPSFPLFNFAALKESHAGDMFLNRGDSQRVADIVEEILTKKVKGEAKEVVIKKRGRKAIAKDIKQWDDPSITLKEIIENDLAGTPTEAELKMREEKLRKMREKKALKRAEREKGTTAEIPAIEAPITTAPALSNTFNLILEPLVDTNQFNFVPQLIFKDGKLVVDNSTFKEADKKLVIVDNKKPYKVTSMSFRPKNHTPKWTLEETRKFYKAIEIFGADFSMIAKLFPTRTRDQIKNKFRKEEKTNIAIMDGAFKKHKVLGKRSIMDRIANFNNALVSDQTPALADTNLSLESFNTIERTFSNTSTDSMDMKIMEEIQNIFIKEIRPQNTISLLNNPTPAGPFEICNNEEFVPKATEISEGGLNRAGETSVISMSETTRKEEGMANNKNNLLMRFL